MDETREQGPFHYKDTDPLTKIDFILVSNAAVPTPRSAAVLNIELHAARADHLPVPLCVELRAALLVMRRSAVNDMAANTKFGLLLDQIP